MQPIKHCLRLLCCLAFFSAQAQQAPTPWLEKKVSLNARNQSLQWVLEQIEKQTGVVFSYNTRQVNDRKTVSLLYNRTALRLVLEGLMQSTGYRYRIKNNYIILYAGIKHTPDSPSLSLLRGYVYNRADGSVVENASIYTPSGKHAAVSDRYGYFSLELPAKKNSVSLAIAKEHYRDTLLVINGPQDASVKLYLTPEQKPAPPETIPSDSAQTVIPADTIMPAAADTVLPAAEPPLSRWRNLNKMRVNLRNIKDTLFNNASFSLVPPLSTNKLLSFNTVNRFSLNLLAGYSKGVRYAEIGGIVNIDDGDVSYAQVGGIGNLVSGSVRGAQVGGIFSINRQNTTGAQVGGIYAHTHALVKGAQVAGIAGRAQKTDGAQVAGIAASTGHLRGAQISGIASQADTVKGVQLSGLVNHTRYLKGIQISGFYNYAQNQRGFQLGLINVSESASGIPLGLFSYVKKGYHQAEVWINETQMAGLGFRSGVEYLHNIVLAGIGLNAANRSWSFGYGLGCNVALTQKFGISTDITAQKISPVDGPQYYLDLVSRLQVAAGFRPAKKFHLAVGPSFNIRVADTRSPAYAQAIHTGLISYLHDRDEGGTSTINTKMWLGATVALRFL